MSPRFSSANEFPYLRDQGEERIQRRYNDIHGQGFSWRIWAVAGFGFFADSYCVFSINAVLPWIAFIYRSNSVFSNRDELKINTVLLVGTIFGQLFFGIFADTSGRVKAYSWDLILVIYATVLLAESSTGAGNSMSIMGWICFWSFFVGVGTGAGRILSAIVTAEYTRPFHNRLPSTFYYRIQTIISYMCKLPLFRFAPVQYRARMMAGVFLMQPLGRLTASAMSLLTLKTLGKSRGLTLETNQEISRSAIDSMWRLVIGIGSVPAFLALILRLTIPESPRFTFDKKNHRLPSEQLVRPSLCSSIKRYFSASGNWRYLAGTSACSLLFETAYSGLGINNPQVLARIWSPLPLTNSTSHLLDRVDLSQPDTSIYQTFMQDAIHSVIAVSAGSIVGSLLLIMSIDYMSRKKLLVWSFLGLAFLFVIIGGYLFSTALMNLHALRIVLYILTQLLSNLGPNALIFIISAEIFPTRYRSTCYGISASFGTFGTLIIHIVISYTSIGIPSIVNLRLMLIIFSTFMFCGAVIAWVWIPEVQELRRGRHLRMSSKVLEVLAEGVDAEGGRSID